MQVSCAVAQAQLLAAVTSTAMDGSWAQDLPAVVSIHHCRLCSIVPVCLFGALDMAHECSTLHRQMRDSAVEHQAWCLLGGTRGPYGLPTNAECM